jgi:GGDEF domain-containing protein
VVGQTVGRCLRPTDFVGRWLENEFMAILMECSEEEVQFVAKRVRGMVLQAKVQWWGDPLSINISMGSASAREGDTSVALIARAEASLGKNLQPTASFAS